MKIQGIALKYWKRCLRRLYEIGLTEKQARECLDECNHMIEMYKPTTWQRI